MLETEEDKLQPETRAMLMQAVEQMRAAGAVVVIDPKLLPPPAKVSGPGIPSH